MHTIRATREQSMNAFNRRIGLNVKIIAFRRRFFRLRNLETKVSVVEETSFQVEAFSERDF